MLKKIRRSRIGRQKLPTKEKNLKLFVHNVVNFSGVPLSDHKLSLLSPDLSFSPSHPFDIFSTLIDIIRVIRNLILRKHFKVEEVSERLPDLNDPHSPMINVSFFIF